MTKYNSNIAIEDLHGQYMAELQIKGDIEDNSKVIFSSTVFEENVKGLS